MSGTFWPSHTLGRISKSRQKKTATAECLHDTPNSSVKAKPNNLTRVATLVKLFGFAGDQNQGLLKDFQAP